MEGKLCCCSEDIASQEVLEEDERLELSYKSQDYHTPQAIVGLIKGLPAICYIFGLLSFLFMAKSQAPIPQSYKNSPTPTHTHYGYPFLLILSYQITLKFKVKGHLLEQSIYS